ncbi:MAG: 3-phosphoshikimate 1-carboxyvinyltransferase [Thermoplasmata archaeon]
MSRLRVVPQLLRGSIRGPPSKSYTHRALVAGHLAGQRYRLVRPLDAEDTRATVRLLRALGTRVERRGTAWMLIPERRRPTRLRRVDCGESGTTLRFAVPLTALSARPVRLVGAPRLGARPLLPLLRSVSRLGARVEAPDSGRTELPLRIQGPIRPGSIALPMSESSQFASALFLTLPILDGPSRVRLQGAIVSEPYLDATMAVLRFHRVEAARHGRVFSTPGFQQYRGDRFEVPADASSAAYLWAGAAVSGGRVTVSGFGPEWPQADLAVLDLLEAWGAEVSRRPDRATVGARHRRPFAVDLTRSPDLLPLAGVLAALTPGRSLLRGAGHAAFKESDRRATTARLARSLGARVRVGSQAIEIVGRVLPRSLRLTDLTDHRLLLSAVVAALALPAPSVLGPAEAAAKSFPTYRTVFGSAGVQLEKHRSTTTD